MGMKMLIDAAHPEETRVVVAQGNRIEEFDFESANKRQLRGSIYLAKVTRVEPSLQAAFVDYGGNRHGFLAFSEIHPDYYQIPTADRQALLEAQAEEERRLAEEMDEDDGDRRRGSRGDGGRSDSGGRRRGRRGGQRAGGRNGQRRGGRRNRRDRDRPGRDGDSVLTIDANLDEATDAPVLPAPSDAVFGSPAAEAVDLGTAEAGEMPLFGYDADASPLTETASDGPHVDAPQDHDDETAPAWSGEGSLGWATPRDDGDREPSTRVQAEPAEGGAAQPLLSDPTPSIAIPLPDETPEHDSGDEAADSEDTTEARGPQSDPDDSADAEADDAATESDDAPSDGEDGEAQTDDAALDNAVSDDLDDSVSDDDDGSDDVTSDEAHTDAQDSDDLDDDEDGDDDRGTEDRERDDDEDGDDGDDGDDDSDDEEDSSSRNDEIETVVADDSDDEMRQSRRARLKTYKIQEVIQRRQIMLVQVVKEERGTKGAALTTYLSLAGRYCVLMPNTARGGGISRKITNANDRKRLKQAAGTLDVPEGMGLIVRTAGAQRTKTEIKRDYEYLLRLWESVRDLTLRSSAPTLVYEEGNLVKRTIRDLYNKDIEAVLVEGEDGYKEAKGFMRMLMPSHAKNVQPYRDRMPLFQRFQVEAQLDSMFSPQVQLPSGGYLVIHSTEALVAIDVNSGRSTREHSIEETALKTNLESAEEVARQLRLRDLAGLIVIDFIDMEETRNNKAVERKLKECLKSDRARIQVGRISGFGLLEMSRQRLRAGVLEGSTVTCPHCEGSGKMRSVESAALRVLRACEEEGLRERCASVTVRVPPTVALYILNQKRPQLMEIERRYGLLVMVEADHEMYASDMAMERGEPLTAERKARIADAVSMETAYTETIPDEDLEDDLADDEDEADDETIEAIEAIEATPSEDDTESDDRPRRRRRGGRRRRRGEEDVRADDEADTETETDADIDADAEDDADGDDDSAQASDADGDDDKPRRRRRRGKRGGRRNRRNGVAEGAEGADLADADQPAMAAWFTEDGAVAERPESGPTETASLDEPDTATVSLQDASDADGTETTETTEFDFDDPKPEFHFDQEDGAPGSAEDADADADTDAGTAEPDTPETAEPDPQPVLSEPDPATAPEPQEKKRGWWQRRFFSL